MTNNHNTDSPRPLRVMFLVTSMPVGGAEVLLVNLIRGIDRQRFTPELCCLKERGPLGEELAAEIPVFENLIASKYDLRVLPRLTELFRLRKVDAVITVGAGDKMFWGRIAAYLAGVPVVASAIHSTGWPDGINWLNRRLTRITDRFIGVAEAHGNHLREVEGFPAEKVVVIPNGIDTRRFVPDLASRMEIRMELGIDPLAPVCGIVAALRPEKDHGLFLQAARRVVNDCPTARFLIVGDGPQRAEIEALRCELNLESEVILTGNRADIPKLLAAMDLFALTSKNEASPVSILEAMSVGLPIVAPRVGSIPQAVDEGNSGFLVPAGDLGQTSQAIGTLLQDPELRRAMGKRGREKVQAYGSLESMVQGYEDLILTVYQTKHPHGKVYMKSPASAPEQVVERREPIAN